MALGDRYLDHLRDRVFPGGCFFATAVLEMGTGPGPVRERVAAFQRELFGLIAGLVAAAQQEGGLVGEEPRALAFEINAQFLATSAAFVLADDPRVLELARSILHRRLGGGGVAAWLGSAAPCGASSRPEPPRRSARSATMVMMVPARGPLRRAMAAPLSAHVGRRSATTTRFAAARGGREGQCPAASWLPG